MNCELTAGGCWVSYHYEEARKRLHEFVRYIPPAAFNSGGLQLVGCRGLGGAAKNSRIALFSFSQTLPLYICCRLVRDGSWAVDAHRAGCNILQGYQLNPSELT